MFNIMIVSVLKTIKYYSTTLYYDKILILSMTDMAVSSIIDSDEY